MRTQKTKTPR